MNVQDRYTFTQAERLCNRPTIDKLFGIRKMLFAYPFKVSFLVEENDKAQDEAPCQALFSVPKRNFKRAVHRNLLRRRCREAFRLNNHDFYNQLNADGKRISVLFIYIEKEQLEYAKIEHGMKQAFVKIGKALKA